MQRRLSHSVSNIATPETVTASLPEADRSDDWQCAKTSHKRVWHHALTLMINGNMLEALTTVGEQEHNTVQALLLHGRVATSLTAVYREWPNAKKKIANWCTTHGGKPSAVRGAESLSKLTATGTVMGFTPSPLNVCHVLIAMLHVGVEA